MRCCWNIWYRLTEQTRQYNTAHAHCMLRLLTVPALIICNTCGFYTAIMVTWTRLNVTFIPTLPVFFDTQSHMFYRKYRLCNQIVVFINKRHNKWLSVGPTQPIIQWVPDPFRGGGVKRPECGLDHTPPFSAEVKERVELYLYSASGSSRPVLGWTFIMTLKLLINTRFNTAHLFRWNSFLFLCYRREVRYICPILERVGKVHY